jgi:hypothetical protein
MNPEDQQHSQPHKIIKRNTPRHPDPVEVAAPSARRVCKINKCGREFYADDRCRAHYERRLRYGQDFPEIPIRRGARLREPGYSAALAAVTAARGKASGQVCVECGQPAWAWCYDHGDPQERREARHGWPYSLDPARYVPRCRACHRKADHRNRPTRGNARCSA